MYKLWILFRFFSDEFLLGSFLPFLELFSAVLAKIQKFDLEEFSDVFNRSFTIIAICVDENLSF